MNKYYNGEQFELLRKKGFTRMSYDELPPKEALYCKLNECDISDEDYSRAQKV